MANRRDHSESLDGLSAQEARQSLGQTLGEWVGDRQELLIPTENSLQRGRTLLELIQQPDGTWTATQVDVSVEGTGETAALAAMEYCRQLAENPPD